MRVGFVPTLGVLQPWILLLQNSWLANPLPAYGFPACFTALHGSYLAVHLGTRHDEE